jgi:hypothetical protein
MGRRMSKTHVKKLKKVAYTPLFLAGMNRYLRQLRQFFVVFLGSRCHPKAGSCHSMLLYVSAGVNLLGLDVAPLLFLTLQNATPVTHTPVAQLMGQFASHGAQHFRKRYHHSAIMTKTTSPQHNIGCLDYTGIKFQSHRTPAGVTSNVPVMKRKGQSSPMHSVPDTGGTENTVPPVSASKYQIPANVA